MNTSCVCSTAAVSSVAGRECAYFRCPYRYERHRAPVQTSSQIRLRDAKGVSVRRSVGQRRLSRRGPQVTGCLSSSKTPKRTIQRCHPNRFQTSEPEPEPEMCMCGLIGPALGLVAWSEAPQALPLKGAMSKGQETSEQGNNEIRGKGKYCTSFIKVEPTPLQK